MIIYIYAYFDSRRSPVWYNLTAIQDVPGSIPGYTLELFLEL